MATITARKRKDGTRYTAQIRIRRNGVIVHSEAETFERRQAAVAWAKRRETELAEPGAFEEKVDPLLSKVIDRYIKESVHDLGRTKEQVLRSISVAPIGSTPASKVTALVIVTFAQSLAVQPQTVENYLSHLSPIFSVAGPAWGIPLDPKQLRDARQVLKRLGATSKSRKRDRRPTLAELDLILNHYARLSTQDPEGIPMLHICIFAMFSTRRQEEICRITWKDYEGDRVMVRDMKHPGQKIGNDTWCDIPEPARRVIEVQPRNSDKIFPFNSRSVSASFTRATQFLDIEDLHFHDLRHEGTSRLFEMGLNIPHVAAVTGHRSWSSLKRYAHIRQTGDKFAGWAWLEKYPPLPVKAHLEI